MSNGTIANPAPGDLLALEVEELGGLGDGLARCAGRPVYVPFTVPGDLIAARVTAVNSRFIKAELVRVDSPGPERAEAPCPHFTVCGGCGLQHLSTEPYYRLRERIAREAVERAGYHGARIEPAVRIGPASRRRAELKVTVSDSGVRLGFYGRKSHAVVDVRSCPLLEPELERILTPLRLLCGDLRGGRLLESAKLTAADTGIDLVLTAKAGLNPTDAPALFAFAETNDLARVSWKSGGGVTEVVSRGPVQALFAAVSVDLPPGAFLQATRLGLSSITELILAEIRSPARVADLYAGCGAYSFPLAALPCRVAVFEGDEAMAEAARAAARRFGMAGTVAVERRDLFRSPVEAGRLRAFDAVVVNPPRNGAEPQVAAVAESGAPLVIMVSCNPRTLERDAKQLKTGGYRLERLVPVDQFFWSAHIESVAVFRR
jgi:23S rRNA (uracil1939-C5)-methyltransferase